ncbi:MAG: Zn-dependent oligopeptidase [Cyclobacteriaceae bacterium]|nr:Zn-dependent oligopeptidase [Cyclobacteriaceae bacterium SS2]
MKQYLAIFTILVCLLGCEQNQQATKVGNPLLVELNDPIIFDSLTAEYVQEAFDTSKIQLSGLIDEIVSIPDAEKSFENTMVKLDDLYNDLSNRYALVYLMGSTHPDSAIRETAVKVRNDFAIMFNELQLNEDLYAAIKTYSQSSEAKSLKGAKAKFLEETIIEFERNGFALGVEEREQLKEILNELSTISNEFSANIAKYQDHLILSEAQMEGLPEDYKRAHQQDDGTYKVGLSYPDYRPFMQYAKSDKARKQLYIKYNNRAADSNLEVLDKMLIKRKEMADLLGYGTFAEYQTETRMAKDPTTVWDFETKLTNSVKPKGQQDYLQLLDHKKSLGLQGDKVNHWEFSYIENLLKTTEYGVDEEIVRQYFPIENVKDGLFQITQKLFGVTYKKIEDASVWHPDVELYHVIDNGKVIGRFYLDLHPRPNKYNHAACFPMRLSKQMDKGFQIPTASLVCNFTEPTEDKPALMTHSEVNTFFHEFGHVLHNMFSKTELSAQAGTSVSRDFVEAPSQIFENWAWNYESLSLFAKHFETGEVLPQELFDKMLATKNLNSGLNTLQQIFYGSYDMTLHDKFDPSGDITTTEVLKELIGSIQLYDYVPGTHFQAAFGHLNGYAASYYGYLWSDVYAQDMFSVFEEKGILNPEVGMDYRNKILSRGSEEDEMKMLIDFLGREPNDKAFVKSLGLE